MRIRFYKSSITGRFVRPWYARSHPNTTYAVRWRDLLKRGRK